MLKHALKSKMGFDPTNSHYGTDDNKAVINEEPVASPQPPHRETHRSDHPTNPTPSSNAKVDEGMYL